MTQRELTRRHLEALVVARAIVAADPAPILDRLDRGVVSPAVVALVEQLLEDDDAPVRVRTKGQRELADRAEAITLGEILFYPLDTLLGLVNGLTPHATQPKAWERDLATGLEQEAAA